MTKAINLRRAQAYRALEETNPIFSATAARAREVTENEIHREFIYRKISESLGKAMEADRIEWVLDNFSQQVEREKSEVAIDPKSGWSVQKARRLAHLSGPTPDGFYFPANEDSLRENKPSTNWWQPIGNRCSIFGTADFVTALHLFWPLGDTTSETCLLDDLDELERDTLPRFLRRTTDGPVPEAVYTFLGKIRGHDWSYDLESRRYRSISGEAVTETGYPIRMHVSAGERHAALEHGMFKLSVLPRSG